MQLEDLTSYVEVRENHAQIKWNSTGRYLLSDECDDAGEPLPKGRLPGVGEEGAG